MRDLPVVFAILVSAIFIFAPKAFAQESIPENVLVAQQEVSIEAKVVKILEEAQIIPAGGKVLQTYQKLQLQITSGPQKGKLIIIENGNLPSANTPKYIVGDALLLTQDKDNHGNDTYFITDYARYHSLLPLLILFIVVTIVVGRWRGFTSLIGMTLSFLIIFIFILPQLASGNDPLTITIIGSLIIVPLTFYLAHGINKKTTVAVAGTFVTLIIIGILATTFVNGTKLTGFASEEAGYLQAFHPGLYNIKGLLLAGIIIGALGILNDITVSQAAIVAELRKESKKSHSAICTTGQ